MIDLTRREALKRLFVVAVLGAAIVSAGCSGPAAEVRPNIIVVSLDTLRADHLSLYGYPRPTSPNLEALAEEAIVFDHATAQAAATAPSHHSLFQSRIASQTGPEMITLAEVLQANGYQTLGLTGGGMMSRSFGFGRGFDHYDPRPRRDLAETLSQLEAWLDEKPRHPWYVFLHTYEIHLPYAPPPPYDTMFFPEYDGRINKRKATEVCRKIRRILNYSDFEGEVSLSGADREKIKALYDGGIRSADASIGRLVELLDTRGRLDDTLLVVLSDHGEEFWDHGSVLHGHSVYQELLHVPLIVRLPRSRHGGFRAAETVRLLDVAPTILELVGLPVPPSFQGGSLVAEIVGQSSEPRAVVSEAESLKTRIEMPWKLIVDTEVPGPALFHLENDPQEQNDVASQYPNRVTSLVEALNRAIDGQHQGVPTVPTDKVSAELREQLQALGYLE